MNEKGKLEALAAMIAAEIKGAPHRPKLRIITKDDFASELKPQLDPITRASHLRRIRWIRKVYGLEWLVDQHVFGLSGPDCLEDGDLLELHREMEKARECIVENIPLEDVGLIRTQPL